MNFNQYKVDENGVGTPVSPIEITEADYYIRHSDGLNWGDYLTLQRIAFDEWAKSNTIQTDALAGAYNKELFKKGWQFYADAMDGWHKPLNGMQRKEMQKTRDYWYFIDKGVKQETPPMELANALEKQNFKVVFGLQPEHIKLIQEYSLKYGGFNNHVFRDVAKIVSWDALTLACYFMEWQSTQPNPELTRLKALVEKYEKALTLISKLEVISAKPHNDLTLEMARIAANALNQQQP